MTSLKVISPSCMQLNGHRFRTASCSPDAVLIAEYPIRGNAVMSFPGQPNCPASLILEELKVFKSALLLWNYHISCSSHMAVMMNQPHAAGLIRYTNLFSKKVSMSSITNSFRKRVSQSSENYDCTEVKYSFRKRVSRLQVKDNFNTSQSSENYYRVQKTNILSEIQNQADNSYKKTINPKNP